MKYPNFLCIGAQKAGTSWLYAQLKNHPGIWVPFIKELHYFNRPEVKRNFYEFFSKKWYGKYMRHTLVRAPLNNSFLWASRFLFLKRTDQYYSSLFEPSAGQICGEVTPAYSRLKVAQVHKLHSLLPDCKIIYLLRNPVDRVWSQINMMKRKNKEYLSLTDDEIFELREIALYSNSSYMNSLKIWESVYSLDQIFIGFFDQIISAPEELLESLYSFLNIDSPSPQHLVDARKVINKGSANKLPQKLEKKITKRLLPELRDLNERFQNSYTNQWLNRATSIIGDLESDELK